MTEQTTDDMLDELARLGCPRVSRCSNGCWHANIEFPAPEGVTAKVASDFNHPSHRAALACVLERLAGMKQMLSLSAEAGDADRQRLP